MFIDRKLKKLFPRSGGAELNRRRNIALRWSASCRYSNWPINIRLLRSHSVWLRLCRAVSLW
jgi:hypothetical protein